MAPVAYYSAVNYRTGLPFVLSLSSPPGFLLLVPSRASLEVVGPRNSVPITVLVFSQLVHLPVTLVVLPQVVPLVLHRILYCSRQSTVQT